jgi:hypothetical protein
LLFSGIGAHELDECLAMLAAGLGEYTAFVAEGAFRRAGTFWDIGISSGRGRRGMMMRGSGAAVGVAMRAQAGFQAGQKTGQHEQLLDGG